MRLATTPNQIGTYNYLLEQGDYGRFPRKPHEIHLAHTAVELAAGSLTTTEVQDSIFNLPPTAAYKPAKVLQALNDCWYRLIVDDPDAKIDAELHQIASPALPIPAEMRCSVVVLPPHAMAVAMAALKWLEPESDMPASWRGRVSDIDRMDAATVLETYSGLQSLQEAAAIVATQEKILRTE